MLGERSGSPTVDVPNVAGIPPGMAMLVVLTAREAPSA
jgi:hypothetical protein